MSIMPVFVAGKFYTLEDIKPIVSQFERVTSKTVNGGLFHLYKQKNTSLFWVGGPFQAPHTTQFLCVGEQESKSQMLKTLKEAFSNLNWKDDSDDHDDYEPMWNYDDFYFPSFFDSIGGDTGDGFDGDD